MIQIKQSGSVTQLTATEGYLHRSGTQTYVKSITLLPGQSAGDWEEVESIPARARADYKERVVALIRARYDTDDEMAILRQRETKPEEFDAYNAYVEECKARVRAEMEGERVV